MTLRLDQFYKDCLARYMQTGERYGQAAFNHLLEVRPSLAEQVRGTECDPFHCTRQADTSVAPAGMRKVWDNFVEFLSQHWDDSA